MNDMTERSPTIIITGAGSGIGRVTARHFLAKGWAVGVIGRQQATLNATADGHENALILPCDVGDAGAVATAFAKARATWSRLDVLFNNAGIFTPARPIDEVTVEDWSNIVQVNLTGSFLCARAAFGWMRAQNPQGGRIINNGSISAHAPRPGSAPYTATKHAISGLTKSISLDGRAFNISCGQIDIGNAATDMAAPMAKGVPQANGQIAAEPLMEVQHVAEAVYQMASLPAGSNIQSLTIMASNMPFIGRG